MTAEPISSPIESWDPIKGPQWICCQLGAREHYAVPRALHHRGVLRALVTDFWCRPSQATARYLPQRLRERYHPALADADVEAANITTVMFAGKNAVTRPSPWDVTFRRNTLFQNCALRTLRRLATAAPEQTRCLFAFSYSALRLFEFARQRGWTTVLGQIDPGPPEERIVTALHQKHHVLSNPSQAPAQYWRTWRQECALADRIVVNSAWSANALDEEGIPTAKISVIPLAYEAPTEADTFQRSYPHMFTHERPLRILFLGQITLRKGAHEILEALRLLSAEPVEIWFVGPVCMELSDDDRMLERTRWFGSVPRGEVAAFYRQADVFLFPTHSDGFGLTQLEAQAWKLPIIASRFCGDVVRHDVNGLILDQLTGSAIAEVIRSLVKTPSRLGVMSENARDRVGCSIGELGQRLVECLSSEVSAPIQGS